MLHASIWVKTHMGRHRKTNKLRVSTPYPVLQSELPFLRKNSPYWLENANFVLNGGSAPRCRKTATKAALPPWDEPRLNLICSHMSSTCMCHLKQGGLCAPYAYIRFQHVKLLPGLAYEGRVTTMRCSGAQMRSEPENQKRWGLSESVEKLIYLKVMCFPSRPDNGEVVTLHCIGSCVSP